MSEKVLQVFETLREKGLAEGEEKPYTIKPDDVIGGNNTVILADQRKGKSYCAAKMCEQLSEVGIPYVIVDPEGEYFSLREKYTVLVVGVESEENCDLSVGVEHAYELGKQFLESKVPLIVDLSGPDLSEEDGHLFLREFMGAIIRKRKEGGVPCLIVIDEADEFIPERGHKARGADYQQFVKLVKKGGKRGIGSVLITHRPTWVAKDLLAKCQNWVLMHQRFKPDLKRIYDLTRIPMEELEKLGKRKVGEALVFGALTKDEAVWVKVLERETTHVGSTPKYVPKFVKRPELESTIILLRREFEKLTLKRERELSEAERLRDEVASLSDEVKERDVVIERLRTAGEAVKMMEKAPAPSKPQVAPATPVNLASYVSRDEYDRLRREMVNIQMGLSTVSVRKASDVWIDDFGSIHSEWPWLIKLAGVNRVDALIVKHLLEVEETTTQEAALKYGFNENTIRRHLLRLERKKVIRKVGSGRPYRFRLVEA